MKYSPQSSNQAALRWLWALAAAAVLLVPAVAEAAAGAGDRPESVSYKSSSGGSSSGGQAASSSRGSSSGGSSSGGKVGSVRGSGGSSGGSSAGKTQSIRSHQSSGSRGGSSGGGSYSGGGSHGHGGYWGHHSYYPRPYRSTSLYFGFGYPYYSWYWPFFYPYYPYYPGAYRRPYYVTEDALGALDLNVKPKDTQVYVNGRFVGTAGQLDGVPRYLWLESGAYELIFYNPGYQTVVREYEIHPDLVIDVKLRMSSGEALPPEQVSRRLDEPRAPRTEVEVEQAWRQAPPAEPPAERPPLRSGSEAIDVRQKPATVLLDVEPADASIYLDGRFVGTGRELMTGLLVDPGKHRVEIVHPAFATRELAFEVAAEENVKLDVRLEAQAAGAS